MVKSRTWWKLEVLVIPELLYKMLTRLERQLVLNLTSFFNCVSFEWCVHCLVEGIGVGYQIFSELFFSMILQYFHIIDFVKFQERESVFFVKGPNKLCKSYIGEKRRPFKVAVYIFNQIKALPNNFSIVFQWGYLLIWKIWWSIKKFKQLNEVCFG